MRYIAKPPRKHRPILRTQIERETR